MTTVVQQRLSIMEPHFPSYKHSFTQATLPLSPAASSHSKQRDSSSDAPTSYCDTSQPRLPSISTLLASVPSPQQATPQPSPDLYREIHARPMLPRFSSAPLSITYSARPSEHSATPSPQSTSAPLAFPSLSALSHHVRPTLPSLHALPGHSPSMPALLTPPLSGGQVPFSQGCSFARPVTQQQEVQGYRSAPGSPASSHGHSSGDGSNAATSPPLAHAAVADRYTCPECQKTFSRPSSLRIHKHSHTGERPYVCTVKGCERAFSVRSNLRRHMKIH